jgi:hypothetical protein
MPMEIHRIMPGTEGFPGLSRIIPQGMVHLKRKNTSAEERRQGHEE